MAAFIFIVMAWICMIDAGKPEVLMYPGIFLSTALKRDRVKNEVRAAIRSAGLEAISEVKVVVFETDGSFSVVRKGTVSGASSLEGVRKPGVHDG